MIKTQNLIFKYKNLSIQFLFWKLIDLLPEEIWWLRCDETIKPVLKLNFIIKGDLSQLIK